MSEIVSLRGLNVEALAQAIEDGVEKNGAIRSERSRRAAL